MQEIFLDISNLEKTLASFSFYSGFTYHSRFNLKSTHLVTLAVRVNFHFCMKKYPHNCEFPLKERLHSLEKKNHLSVGIFFSNTGK